MSSTPATDGASTAPWWTFGHVWLLIAGPVIVVMAGFVTLWLALTRPDPVVQPDDYRRDIGIHRPLEQGPDPSLAPAMKARNHAATPVHDLPR